MNCFPIRQQDNTQVSSICFRNRRPSSDSTILLNDLLDRAIDYVLYPLQFDIGTVRAVLHGKKILCEFHALTMYC